MRKSRALVDLSRAKSVKRRVADVVEQGWRAHGSHRRSLAVQLVTAVPLFCATLIASLVLFDHPGSVPRLPDPGLIAIADLSPDRVPMAVTANFEGSTIDSTYFHLVINSFASVDAPRPLVVIICGGLVETQLGVLDLNEGPLKLRPLPGEGTADSVLGEYAACRYAAFDSTSFQTLLSFASANPIADRSNDRLLYALPHITTVFRAAPIGDLDVHPWPVGTTLRVRLLDVADDFSLDAALPSIQASGELRWDFQEQRNGESPPRRYRVSGTLIEATESTSRRTFGAGVLAGVAGAAFVWTLEVTGRLVLERGPRPTKNRPRRRPSRGRRRRAGKR